MHRSRLYGAFIDAPLAEAAAVVAAVQAVDDAPRYHVDIETDDVDAEVARLAALGGVEISR